MTGAFWGIYGGVRGCFVALLLLASLDVGGTFGVLFLYLFPAWIGFRMTGAFPAAREVDGFKIRLAELAVDRFLSVDKSTEVWAVLQVLPDIFLEKVAPAGYRWCGYGEGQFFGLWFPS